MANTFCDVFFEATPTYRQPQPQRFVLRQREYAHDVMAVTIAYESAWRTKYESGRPVTCQFGIVGGSDTFHGYVHNVEPIVTKGQPRQLRVYSIGTSYQMNAVRQRSFRGKTIDQIAAQIAKDNGKSILVEKDLYAHAHLSQHGMTDMGFLTWLAKQMGYTLYINKTEITLVKRRVNFKDITVPFVYFPTHFVERNAVYEISAQVGDSVPGTNKRGGIAYSVSDSGIASIVSSDGYPPSKTAASVVKAATFSEYQNKIPFTDSAEAVRYVNGKVELEKFNYTATAVLSGDTRVHQASSVHLYSIDNVYDGVWYVTGVDHIIDIKDRRYVLNASLARDSMGNPDVYTPTPMQAIAPSSPSTQGVVILSPSGNPVVVEPCYPTLTATMAPPPGSVYDPVDDCQPVENFNDPGSSLVQVQPGTPSSPSVTAADADIRAKQIARARRRRRAGPRADVALGTQVTRWRATSSITRVTTTQ